MLHWDWECIGQYFFAYNADFDLTSEIIDGIYNKVLNRTYSTNGTKGRLTAISIGDTPLASYSYDAVGRVSDINNVSFGYLANSSLLATVTRPNNVNTTWSYEANRNLVTGVENKLNNTVISNYAYTNDALGRRTAMARSGSVFTTAGDTLSYSYNDRSEVTGATSNSAGTTYNYAYSFDNIGNRLTANLAGTPWTYTANNLNEYSAFTINQVAETPSYDDDGNMQTRDGWTQTWNGENRLIKAEKGTAKLEFAYDYMGRRIFKKVYNGETLTSHIRFVYNGYKLIEELNALNNNAVLRRYTWSPVGLDTPVSVYDAAANATYYYNTDANKNITELTDVTGAVVAHYEYSPFGGVVTATGAYAEDNPFRFSSEYHDSETGLVYYNYRYYSPELGRWLSKDPIGEQGGWNLYWIVQNKMIDVFDILGLKTYRASSVYAILNDLDSGTDLNDALDAYDKKTKSSEKDCSNYSNSDGTESLRDYLAALGGIENFHDTVAFLADDPNNPTWQDYYNAANLVYNPTLGMLEAAFGESYSTGEWGRELEVGERALRGVSSAVSSTMVAWGGYNVVGGIRNKLFNPQLTVTSWAKDGIKPDLNSGRWVMLGGKNPVNYANTGLYARHGNHYGNAITGKINASNLKWPSGWQKVKGIIGQRVIK